MHDSAALVILLIFMAVLAAMARRTTVPYPVALVLAGSVVGFIPGLPREVFPPEEILLIFLPPILASAAYSTPLRDFRSNLRPILLLALGLVLFTTLAVGLVLKLLIPGIAWAVAFTLGAIVAPPDAIAATAVADRLGLPRRLVTILEGESLVNDASALIAYRVASAAALTGAFSLGQATFDFFLVSLGGVAIGVLVAWLMNYLINRLDDAPVEVLITFLAAFGAYLGAEMLHVSGVLAVVSLGLLSGRLSSRVMNAQSRIQADATWDTVVFLLNSLAFLLIGLQLPGVLEGLRDKPLSNLFIYAGAISLTVIAARFIWVFPVTYLSRLLIPKAKRQNPPNRSVLTVLSWAGMRGIVSLAIALALPENFPNRDLLIFLTFAVILVTLVGQGLTLPGLIQRLGLSEDSNLGREETEARLMAALAGLERLAQISSSDPAVKRQADELQKIYASRIELLQTCMVPGQRRATAQHFAQLRQLQSQLNEAELEALIQLRRTDEISDAVLWKIQRELDLERLRLD